MRIRTFICSSIIFWNVVSCKTTANELMLVNGLKDTDGLFKPVFRIGSVRLSSRTLSTCTATAVSANTAITAGHCVVYNDQLLNDISIIEGEPEFIDLQIRSFEGVIPHPAYRSSSVNNDIAVLIFDGEPFKDAYVSLATEPANIGDRVTIIGYGKKDHMDFESAGGRHYGVNDLTNVPSESGRNTLDFLGHPHYVGQSEDGKPIYVDYKDQSQHTTAGKKVGPSQGDSGGPMLANGFIVGISSNIDADLTKEGFIHAHYEYVLGPTAQEFLKSVSTKQGLISGLHNQERRKLVTPRDLEDASLDDTTINANPNAPDTSTRVPLRRECLCTVNDQECRLDVIGRNGQRILDLASDQPEACKMRSCEENFQQYNRICHKITVQKGS